MIRSRDLSASLGNCIEDEIDVNSRKIDGNETQERIGKYQDKNDKEAGDAGVEMRAYF